MHTSVLALSLTKLEDKSKIEGGSQKEGNGKYPHGFALSVVYKDLHPKMLHHRKVVNEVW